MTPKLLNVYVRCFRDDYISVRELACKSSQYLNEKHEKVIESLVFMARFDRVNKLKALAIRSNFIFFINKSIYHFYLLLSLKCLNSNRISRRF
jgi:hypothetical protein